jgi:sulfite reductase alpha subunit-like flavoprotein
MRKPLAVLCSCLWLAAILASAQDEGFQPGRVVAFERVAADAQHMENQDQYKISMRLGDTVYKCHASGSAATFNDWTINKERQAPAGEEP